MKTVLITGSTKGIGKQIGIDLLIKEWYVYFNGHSIKSIKNLTNELTSNFEIINCDLSILENNIKLAKDLINKKIHFDCIVLNLGITDRTKFGKINYDDWKKVFDTNLNCPFFLIQALLNNIKKNGRIIFISSIAGFIPDVVSISYGVSKAGINMLVQYLAKELKEKKITVNAVAPGYIDTDWHKDKSISQIKRIKKKYLLNRLGTASEVSKAVISIINNDFINAQVIRVDGGFICE